MLLLGYFLLAASWDIPVLRSPSSGAYLQAGISHPIFSGLLKTQMCIVCTNYQQDQALDQKHCKKLQRSGFFLFVFPVCGCHSPCLWQMCFNIDLQAGTQFPPSRQRGMTPSIPWPAWAGQECRQPGGTVRRCWEEPVPPGAPEGKNRSGN